MLFAVTSTLPEATAAQRATVDGRPPRLLIVSGNLALLRGHYEGVIGGLVAAGVGVSIRYLSESGGLSADAYRQTLRDAGIVAEVERIKPLRFPAALLAVRLRELGNILRYTHPDYDGKEVLSERAYQKTGSTASALGRRIRRMPPERAARAARAAAWVEATLPAPRYALGLLDDEQPTAVAVVPVIRVPGLIDFLKAGAKRGISTVIWVQSWDNLTNKGLLHFVPDRVFVWNDRQKAELARYHGVPPERVSTTGAQTFEHWFGERRPPERAEFCARMSLDAERPILLYLASSRQIAPEEPEFFERWLAALRASDDPVLASASVLVRPHPTMVAAWTANDPSRHPDVELSPGTRDHAINSEGFRDQYRGELHHATAVFGVNTSGVIDAAIWGKPATSVELPELFNGQRGTVHFEHLARPDGGLLYLDHDLADHMATLAGLIGRDTYASDERSAAFVREFVRPHDEDPDATATGVFVRDMLELCRSQGRSAGHGAATALGRVVAAVANVLGFPLMVARYGGRYGPRFLRIAIYRYGLRWFLDGVRAVLPARLHAWLRRQLVKS